MTEDHNLAGVLAGLMATRMLANRRPRTPEEQAEIDTAALERKVAGELIFKAKLAQEMKDSPRAFKRRIEKANRKRGDK